MKKEITAKNGPLIKNKENGGLWKSVEAVNRHLQNCDEKEKIDRLYVQLQFHNFFPRKVLFPKITYFKSTEN